MFYNLKSQCNYKMSEDRSLIALKAITNFINDVADEYGKKFRSLLLYQHLINKTQINHTKAINKHVEIFKNFSKLNSEALESQDETKLNQSKISYSDKVFVEISELLKEADNETSPVIWQHLLTISAVVDPTSKAKEVLKNIDNKEEKFVEDIIGKVSNTDATNPMEMISSLMSGGGMQEMMNNGGNMDMSKMFGVVGKLLDNLDEQAGDDPQAKQMTGNLTSSLSGQGDKPPDMGQLMSTVMGAFSNLQNTSSLPVIEEVDEKNDKVVDEKEK